MATSMRKISLSNFTKNPSFHVCKRTAWLQLQRLNQTAAQVTTHSSDVHKAKPPEIVFPRKKKRDSLSVLKCLAATVQRDPTAGNYIYMDDPYLLPHNVNEKRIYAAAKASGRRAARYIVNNYPESFVSDMFFEEASVPYVKAFMPDKIKYEIHEVCEEALKERIGMRRVADSIAMYDEIKQQGLELTEETHLSLLHLLTVFNSKEPEEQMYVEDFKWRKQFGLDSHLYHKTWQKDSAAERVFQDLPVKSPEAYCSMVKGFSKYLEGEKAMVFFEEMMNKDMPIDVQTYNMILRMTPTKYLDDEAKWGKNMEILSHMQKKSVRPNIDTFTQLLHVLKTCSLKFQQKMVFRILNEVKHSNIEPSLGIYCFVIDIAYKSDAVSHPFLSQLIDYLKDTRYEFVHKEDFEFFTTAMNVCYKNLHDVELAKKIDDYLNSYDHYKFMADIEAESAYSKHFFALSCQFRPIEEIMDLYHRLVPNCWSPTYTAIKELIGTIDLHDGYQYLPEIWIGLDRNNALIQEILSPYFEVITKKKHELELQEKFSDLVDALVQRFKSELEEGFQMKAQTIRIDSAMVGNFIIIKLDAERLEEAWNMLEFYKQYKRHLAGHISERSIQMLLDECIKQKDTDKALKCIQIMTNEEFKGLKEYKAKVMKELELTDLEREHIEITS